MLPVGRLLPPTPIAVTHCTTVPFYDLRDARSPLRLLLHTGPGLTGCTCLGLPLPHYFLHIAVTQLIWVRWITNGVD